MNEAARRQKGIALAAAAIFLVLSWTSVRKGQEGVWHERCVDFWKKRQWIELKTLAQNLENAGRSDSETLYFGMLAANQTRDSAGTRELGIKLLKSHTLNLKIEKGVASILRPASAREYLTLFRTRFVLLLWVALGVLQILYGVGRNSAPYWIFCVSLLGIFILML